MKNESIDGTVTLATAKYPGGVDPGIRDAENLLTPHFDSNLTLLFVGAKRANLHTCSVR